MKRILERFLIYTLTIFAVAVSLPIAIEYGDIVVFSENGPVEWLQLTVLVLGACFLLLASCVKDCEFSELFRILALVQFCAVSRELDSILNKHLWLGWTLPVMVFILGGAIVFWSKKEVVVQQTVRFVGSRSFALMWCGFIVAAPYSQLVGHGKFLELLMGDDYVRGYKRVIEELARISHRCSL